MPSFFVAHKAFLVNPHGKVLFMRHVEEGFLDIPGGRMHEGETWREAFAREVCEETSLEVNLDEAVPFHEDEWDIAGDAARGHVVAFFYRIEVSAVQAAAVKCLDGHDASVWIDPRNPSFEGMSTITRRAFEKYIDVFKTHGLDERIKGRQGYGLVQLIHGTGKGKTTASLGQAIRCAGAGKRVKIVYFDKGGTTHYSERKIIEGIPNISYTATGRDRIDPVTGRFDFSIVDVDKTEAARGLEEARQVLTSGEYDLVVLDEINSTTDLGMVDVDAVCAVIDGKRDDVELILTGRNPSLKFLERAHLITEMKMEHHYFYSGVQAREGLDF